MLIDFIQHFGSSFMTALGFAILYNIPRRTIAPAGLTGAIGWTIYFFLTTYLNVQSVLATSMASFFIAFASQIFARRLKSPVIVFTLPGLIPLVPGGMAYNMMRAFVEGEMILGFQFATNTFLTAGALALGLSINGAFFQLISSRNIFNRGNKYVP
ncbi:MAG TPA: threonine/serine exporter family protein [Atopostipes sp.]|nr:threonine/serine exporter family protein [Atopostipes sp.]